MLHLESFDQNVLNNILNIARDEGIFVYNPYEAHQYDWNEEYYYFDRYPVEDGDYDNPTGKPVMSVKKFVDIMQDIYRRLDNEGLVNHKKSSRTGNIFSLYGGETYLGITSPEIDLEEDLTFATIAILDDGVYN